MVVKRDADDGIDENAELRCVGDAVRQAGVERVDAFHKQHGTGREAQCFAVVFADAGHEVVFRHLYFFAVQKLYKVVLHRFVVHGVEVVEVETAVRQARGVETVDEVVVGRYRQGLQAAGHKLYAEALGNGGLAAAARAGDEHQAQVAVLIAAVDFFCYLDYFLFLQSLGYLDELGGVSFLAGVVHVADVVEVHNGVPPEALAEHLVGLGLGLEASQLVGSVPVRDAQQHPVFIGGQVPYFKVAGRRHEGVIVVVRSAFQGVVAYVGLAAGLEELHLVVVPHSPEKGYGVVGAHFNALERGVALDYFAHPAADAGHVFRRHGRAFAQFAEVALRDGTAHLQLAVREQVEAGFAEQEAERPAVGAAARVGTVVQEFYVAAVEGPVFQALGHVVHLGAENVEGTFEFEAGKHFRQSGALLEFLGGAGVLAIYLQHRLQK